MHSVAAATVVAPSARGRVPTEPRPSDSIECRELAVDTSPPNPDAPSPFNSDHTRKRLGPSPPGEPDHTILFRYDDFGPQVLASRLIGMDWWSWEAGGSFEPTDSFDVRVVVFRDRTVEQVAARYPTIEKASDYRLVSRESALRYLDEAERELRASPKGPDEYDFGPLISRLERTRATILKCLPAAAPPRSE